ncbi:hypothetical protein BDN72DRAFT_170333 [Pluteus cervinus]|uniref:Uncharacterized protein n=1 Tax=Pluteus cervinus TaxID=181527 RepID=A0ACD3AJW9_9AGAR|nr:hypothetical protein BDN72DRAFT_170333 [Pluteus cervinus]
MEPSLSRKVRNGDRDSVASSRPSSPAVQPSSFKVPGSPKAKAHSQLARAPATRPPSPPQAPPPIPSLPPPPPDDPPFRPESRSATASSTVRPGLPTPKGSETATTIQDLKSRLAILRSHMEVVLQKEEVILVQLKKLGDGAGVENGNTSALPTAADSIPVLKAKLKLKNMALENEKRLRAEAEAVVKDIQRECKEPFVVPALVDAFVQISHMTTKLAGSGSGSNVDVSNVVSKSIGMGGWSL